MKKILLALALLLSAPVWATAVSVINNGSNNTSASGAWLLTETGATAQQTSFANPTILTAYSTTALPVGFCTAFTVTVSDVVQGAMLYGAQGTDNSHTITVLLYDTAATTNNISSVINSSGTLTVTTTAPHNMNTNDWVSISGVTGAGAIVANCTCQITKTGASAFSLQGITGSGNANANTGIWNHVASNGTPGQQCMTTVNETDIPASGNQGWIYFKFPYTYTGTGTAGINRIGIYTTATTGMPSFYRDTTASNWTRLLPLTATHTLAAVDFMYVVGALTAPATNTPYTVTADDWSTSAVANSFTASASASTGTSITHTTLDIGAYGTFAFPTSSSGLSGTSISAATNASPIVCTVASGAPATGTTVTISGATGNTAANGIWTVTHVTGTTFSLNGSTGNGTYGAGSGTYVYSTCYEQFAGNINVWGLGTFTGGIPVGVTGAVALSGGVNANPVKCICAFNEGSTSSQYGLIGNNGSFTYSQGYNFSGGATWTTLATDYPLPPVTEAITGATNASPIVITLGSALAFAPSAGSQVIIGNVTGNTAANGNWYVATSPVPTTTTFGLASNTAGTTPVAGNGAYVSGGTAWFPYTITAVTSNGPPATITVTPAISGGAPAVNSYVAVSGALGDTAINGAYQVSSASTASNVTTVGLTGVTGSGTYTANSGQLWTQLTATTAVSTGFLNGDELCFASTDQTISHCETQTLNGAASGATLTLSQPLLYPHGGTTAIANVVGECGDLTRNFVIRGESSTYEAYVSFSATATTNMTWTEFYYLGGSATTTKQGIYSAQTSTPFTMQYCSMHDYDASTGYGIQVTGALTTGAITTSNNVSYNIFSAFYNFVNGGSFTCSDNLIVYSPGASGIIIGNSGSPVITLTNCNVAGVAYAILFDNNGDRAQAINGTVSGLVGHSCSAYGLDMAYVTGGTVSSSSFWRNQYGISNGVVPYTSDVTISSCSVWGNSGGGIYMPGAANITFNACSFDAGVGLLQPSGWLISTNNTVGDATSSGNFVFINCNFGKNQTHASGDIFTYIGGKCFATAQFYNCYLYSPTQVANQSSLNTGSYLGFSKYQQTTGSYYKIQPEGNCLNDSAITRAGGYSEKCIPNQASSGGVAAGTLHSSNQQARVSSGNTYTVSCYVRTSVSTDPIGAAYTGNNPRIIERANYNAGLSTDTSVVSFTPVTGTISAANSATPIQCTVAGNTLSTGDFITISGGTGETALNGTFQITVVSPGSTFTLNGSTGSGTYNANTAQFSKWVLATVTTASVSDNTVLSFCIGCDGTAGCINVDWAQNAGDINWHDGEHNNFLNVSFGSTQ
jgi:hypothetical protein